MDINKGDLVKVRYGKKMSWNVVTDFREGAVFCYCLEEEEETYFEEGEIEQVVHREPTGQFLSVLSQKEQLVYVSYYTKAAGKMLTDIENRISGTTGNPSDDIASSIHSVDVNITFTDESDKYIENILKKWDTSGNWSKDKELFDPFDDQTPYPLDFDNFVYGDVEQCYDEERDYLVIKCVDDFIEHMMTTR